jgi:hypothetical protein
MGMQDSDEGRQMFSIPGIKLLRSGATLQSLIDFALMQLLDGRLRQTGLTPRV